MVATEIKSLADDSKEAADEIRAITDSIKGAAEIGSFITATASGTEQVQAWRDVLPMCWGRSQRLYGIRKLGSNRSDASKRKMQWIQIPAMRKLWRPCTNQCPAAEISASMQQLVDMNQHLLEDIEQTTENLERFDWQTSLPIISKSWFEKQARAGKEIHSGRYRRSRN